MKKILLVFAVLLLNGVGYCESQDSQLTTQNSAVDEATITSWGNQADFFKKNDFIIIDWEEAKGLLLTNKVKGGKQYHTGWLTIYTLEGDKYLTRQPKIDALWDFMKEKGISIEGFGTE